jgi:hypothetical protein
VANDIDRDARGTARRHDHARVIGRRRRVAQNERARGAGGQRRPRPEPVEIDEVQQQLDARRCDPLVAHEVIDAGFVDRYVTADGGVMQRHLLPRHPAVAEVDDRRAGKRQRGNQGLEVVVPMNDVGGLPHTREIVHHGHRGSPQLVGNLSEQKAECDGPVAPPQEAQRHVADVVLGAGTHAERVIREQDGDRPHGDAAAHLQGAAR